jgi:hypothetical protein
MEKTKNEILAITLREVLLILSFPLIFLEHNY